MRILQVISSFPPAYSYGGALKAAYEISKQLVINGHNVTVYTTDVHDENSRFELEKNPIFRDGVEIYYFKNLSNKLAYKNFPIAPSMAKALKENINEFDIVHLHEYRSFQSMLVHYYSKKNKIPYITQPHGSAVNVMRLFLFKKLFDISIGSSILKGSSKVLALTNAESETIQKFNVDPHDIDFIPNGINLSEFSVLPNRGNFRMKYGIDKGEHLILFLGRLHKIKGIDLLVNTFANLSHIDVKLVIVGPDGGYGSIIRKIVNDLDINDKVIFTGPLYGFEKLEAFVDADLYVLPSIYETFPNTVLEACACGTPVIVTEGCGIKDMVNKHNIGFVVKYDINLLKNAMVKILNDDNLKKEMSNNGKNLVQKELNWEKIVNELEGVYRTVKI